MPRYPWSIPRTPRRPRHLTWYGLITQFFTLLGRLVGRAATSGGARAEPAKRKTSRRRD